MTAPRVRIAGLGIGGSALAYFLSREDITVEGYDPNPGYPKPCGDAVTLRDWIEKFMLEFDVVETYVNEFSIYINNNLIFEKNFNKKIWFIINKNELIRKLRAEAMRYGAQIKRASTKPLQLRGPHTTVVDARGPYAHDKSKWIIVYRGIAQSKWNPHYAVLNFLPELQGLFWIFPADDGGERINFGAGFKNGDLTSSKKLAINKLKKYTNNFNIIDERAAPIAVFSEVAPIGNHIIAIGEAGGLVISTAGEGNRPALESAVGAFLSIKNNKNIKYYKNKIKDLVAEAKLSRRMLRLASRMGSRFGEFAHSLPREFWQLYLTAELNMNYLAKLFIKKFYLIKYLL